MSKVVSGVGRAISSVVGGIVVGATNIVKDVAKGVTKFAKSKLGKAILIAAAVYFGGAALAGGFGGATTAAGTVATGLEGAAAGISNAWTSLGTAASQAAGAITGAEGASFANAGSALSSGFSGEVAGAVTNGMTQSQMLAAQNFGMPGATEMTNQALASASPGAASVPVASVNTPPAGVTPGAVPTTTTTPGVTPGATPPGVNPAAAKVGLIDKVLASPYGFPSVVMAGGQLIGSAMQGYGAQQQFNQQRQLETDARDRLNRNVGTRLWA